MGDGALKKAGQIANERIEAFAKKQDVYLTELAKLLIRTEKAPVGVEGYVSYTTTYAKCKDGYQGRVYAQGVALAKVPRGIRQISYDGLGVRGWGVEMAYFTFDVQIVDKLKMKISCPHFQMDTLRLYLMNRRPIWNSIGGNNAPRSDFERNRLRSAVFNGDDRERESTLVMYIFGIYRGRGGL